MKPDKSPPPPAKMPAKMPDKMPGKGGMCEMRHKQECPTATPGCVTTTCSKMDGLGTVTVQNSFGVSLDLLAAEYVNAGGHSVCDKSQ